MSESAFKKIESFVKPSEFDDILNYHAWRHRIKIREGFVTPGYLSDTYWDISHFPKSFVGKTVLDVGSNDGINAFRSEALGATAVTGIDLYRDNSEQSHTIGWNLYGCETAKKHLKSKVDFVSLNAYEAGQLGKQYDVVILADVMNWLGDIPRLLGAVSSVCGERLIIRDGLMRKNSNTPLLQYVHSPQMDLMYLPNESFMNVILKQNGFKRVTIQKIDIDVLFNEWVADFPLVTSSVEVPVFENPWSTNPIMVTKLNGLQALSKIDDRIYSRGVGWVDVKGLTVQTFQPRPLFKLARKVLGSKSSGWLKSRMARQKEESYTIIAER
jgi:SAM-dependent methyltransferase